jgi:hypothetical protein
METESQVFEIEEFVSERESLFTKVVETKCTGIFQYTILDIIYKMRCHYVNLFDWIAFSESSNFTRMNGINLELKLFRESLVMLQATPMYVEFISYMSVSLNFIEQTDFDFEIWYKMIGTNATIVLDSIYSLNPFTQLQLKQLAFIAVVSSSFISMEFLVKKGFIADEEFVKQSLEWFEKDTTRNCHIIKRLYQYFPHLFEYHHSFLFSRMNLEMVLNDDVFSSKKTIQKTLLVEAKILK